MNRILYFIIFIAGLAVAGWIGAGYIGTNPLALAVIAMIIAAYLAGTAELYRYGQATSGLSRAVAGLSAPPGNLEGWLSSLHPSLRNAVRLRIDGARVGLPGPSLTPYLVGLLVLLGMLGTFLGMVATLRGTGLALESATDLQAIRDSLATPVKGLGFAFGTSVAGVATSAMLGLLSALLRRERLGAAQALDTHIATTLRTHSHAHHREESYKLLQRQAEAMPSVIDKLEAMMTAMQRHNEALNQQLAAGQASFHAKTEAAYTRLAASVEQSLKDGIAEGARAAGTAIEPIAQATMAGLAAETATLHDNIAQSVRQQLNGVSEQLDKTTTAMAGTWATAVAEHHHASKSLADGLRASLDAFIAHTSSQSSSLIEGVAARLDGVAGDVSQAWQTALASHQQTSATLAEELRTSLGGFAANTRQQSSDLLEGIAGRLDEISGNLSRSWADALARQESASAKLANDSRQALTATVDALGQHSASLIQAVDASHYALRSSLTEQETQRLAAWSASLDTIAAGLRQEWARAGQETAAHQREICDTLAQAAREITSETQAQARGTIAEISQLVQAASEAPRAAADVITEVRQKLSDSLARDNAMLEERSRLLETVGTLLDAVNHASSEQRAAVDALVSTSADMLERVGRQFTDKVESEAARLTDTVSTEARKLADTVDTEARRLSDTVGTEARKLTDTIDVEAQRLTYSIDTETRRLADTVSAETGRLAGVGEHVAGGAADVAALAQAFSTAVQAFGASSASLEAHLQRLEAALDKSLARSDEQLAYYVAQAREVVDLSVLSQKQILEELQALSEQRATTGTGAA